MVSNGSLERRLRDRLAQTATRSPSMARTRGAGSLTDSAVSAGSGWPIRSSTTARSSAERAIGPITEMSAADAALKSEWPRIEHRPQVGLWPNSPQ